MSVISRIELSAHRLPLDPPFPAAWDRKPRRSFPVTVYRVFDDEGRMGFGAGDAMRGLVDYLDLFVGSDPLELDRHAAVLENIAFFDGRPWPLEIALWDLAGKIRGEPIWKMLGGASNRIRPYASSGTHWTLGAVPERVEAIVGAGFRALKVRFGRERLADDLSVLEAVLAAGRGRLDVMVDCNQGWRMPWDTHRPWDFKLAYDLAVRLSGMDVYWMEEALHRGDIDGMARLRSQVGIRIAGGEMTREAHELDTLLDHGCLDVYQPDAAVTCGISRLAGFAREVADTGAMFSPHTWGSGVALVANAHLTAGTVGAPYLEYPHDPPEWTADRRDFIFTEPFIPDADGWLTLSDRPGLGVSLDEDRLVATRSESVAYG
jgi:L-alanine-DL-glutamate epimerase-like enolase superfamily enzyme